MSSYELSDVVGDDLIAPQFWLAERSQIAGSPSVIRSRHNHELKTRTLQRSRRWTLCMLRQSLG